MRYFTMDGSAVNLWPQKESWTYMKFRELQGTGFQARTAEQKRIIDDFLVRQIQPRTT